MPCPEATAASVHGNESVDLTEFKDLGLAEPILRAISTEGYTNPTDIQTKAIPAILSGQDVLGIAQTGTGKTAAFVLPLLNRIAGHSQKPAPHTCRALVLAPTRELAAQIGESVRAYGRFVRPSCTIVVGGAKSGPQASGLARGVDIVVATPGRLLDHIGTGVVRLDKTDLVVLDEADQMLDLGFFPAIRRIMGRLAPERQAVLLSATMPKQIRILANEFLRNPSEIAVTPASRPVERIDQKVMLVESSAKRAALVSILNAPDVGRTIVFTRTKRGADRVSAHLQASGLPAAAIHGDKSQGQRERALAAFKGDRIKILVATDIAARGIDIDGVSHVINYELPNVPEAYVHRIGRTARAGASGFAISLCDGAERGLLNDIERLIGRSLLSDADRAAAGMGTAAAGRPAGGKSRSHHRPRADGQRSGRPVSKQLGGRSASKPAHPEAARREAAPHEEAAEAGLSRILDRTNGKSGAGRPRSRNRNRSAKRVA